MRIPGRISTRRKPRPGRGVRLPRKKPFDPILPTTGGIRVRSRYEKICAEFFDHHAIRYLYEPLLLLEGRQYRPDFFLPDYKIFIEICGFTHMPFYTDRVARKQALYERQRIRALFVYYNGRGSLPELLTRQLQDSGIHLDEKRASSDHSFCSE